VLEYGLGDVLELHGGLMIVRASSESMEVRNSPIEIF
jgi:hypothetical protein